MACFTEVTTAEVTLKKPCKHGRFSIQKTFLRRANRKVRESFVKRNVIEGERLYSLSISVSSQSQNCTRTSMSRSFVSLSNSAEVRQCLIMYFTHIFLCKYSSSDEWQAVCLQLQERMREICQDRMCH